MEFFQKNRCFDLKYDKILIKPYFCSFSIYQMILNLKTDKYNYRISSKLIIYSLYYDYLINKNI